jgi:hypothetical protein
LRIAHVGEIYHLLLAGTTEPSFFYRSHVFPVFMAGIGHAELDTLTHEINAINFWGG